MVESSIEPAQKKRKKEETSSAATENNEGHAAFPKSFEMLSREHVAKLQSAVMDEDDAGLNFVRKVWASVREGLQKVLAMREKDRAFIDQRQHAVSTLNARLGRRKGDPLYESVIGQRDAEGRVVIGPLSENYDQPDGAPVAPLPEFLKGYHVTLFGLSDSRAACEASMKCYSHKLEEEPQIVELLLRGEDEITPFWGVDFEDSQTPLKTVFDPANDFLAECYSRDAPAEGRVKPIKRLPGLAIPCTWCFHDNEPVPLFLYDFALHLYRQWSRPESLAFYMPKLENEEEAAFLGQVIRVAEQLICAMHPEYREGTVRIIVVIETARSVFRVNEIADALYPYFAGTSLGWHDFLASTARFYREDPDYLIPVKADGSIVISHIRASHELVARVVGGRGGLAIGGMYGVLPGEDGVALGHPMFQAALFGLLKDVVTQLKRGLIGFWLPHFDYVRLGLAIVAAYKCMKMDVNNSAGPMEELVTGLIRDPTKQAELLSFIKSPDPAPALKRRKKRMVKADVNTSQQIARSNSTCEALLAEVAMKQKVAEFLQTVDILKSLDDEEREQLVEVLRVRNFEKGQQIIRQGEVGTEFFMLMDGTAYASISGKHVAEYVPGQYFGELALLRKAPRSVDVFADASPTTIAVLNADDFNRLLGNLNDIMAERAKDYVKIQSSLIVADLPVSTVIHNNDPEEVRYNVFQSLQYLADWLCGNGCVALPATSNGQPVRVMDDLATVERSRWEVWHQIRHGRFPVESLIKIAHQELIYIRKYNPATGKRPVHVRWNERTSKWYPVAMEIVLKLMTVSPSGAVVEFVPQLLTPFTDPEIRQSDSPLEALHRIDPDRLRLEPYVARFHYFFERCGVVRFAKKMAQTTVTDLRLVDELINTFDFEDAVQAASFHGDIGQNAATLDKMAGKEQAGVAADEGAELRALGAKYLEKFGIKFMVSAKNKSGQEMKALMLERMNNTSLQELENAKQALLQITKLRIKDQPQENDKLFDHIEALRKKHGVKGTQMSITRRNDRGHQTLCLGEAAPGRPVRPNTLFEIASLSKTVASAFALELFKEHGIALTTPVNELLARLGSDFRITHAEWGPLVRVGHLMSHAALNMHYLNGVPLGRRMPNARELLNGSMEFNYPAIDVVGKPGSIFRYSGGGFLVLEHIVEKILKLPIAEATQPFLDSLGLTGDDAITFNAGSFDHDVAHGFRDSGELVEGTRLMFPAFGAGALGTARAVTKFLEILTAAYLDPHTTKPISHETAVTMLYGTDKGCMEFMGCRMGMGIFVAEAGPNKIAIHQGANDGFRGVYVHCFEGPDRGVGLTCFANSDNRAMLFIAEAMQAILAVQNLQGVDYSRFSSAANLSIDKVPQEQIVNMGYKNLVFCAFQPTLPPTIIDRGPPDEHASKNQMVGASLIRCSSQRFALASNLASDHLPKFDPELFCPMGKVMDSWETPRHNELGFDFAEFKLAHHSSFSFVYISTKYHSGNQPERCRLLCRASHYQEWIEFVPENSLMGHAEKVIALPAPMTATEVRVEMFPDGGLTRIGLFSAQDVPDEYRVLAMPVDLSKNRKHADPIPHTKKPMQLLYTPTPEEVEINRNSLRPGERFDAASLAYGGKLLDVTNEHYGPAAQVLSPYVPLSMHDGFESARSREKGHREVLTIGLSTPTKIETIELDMTYFVNNNPRSVAILGFDDAKQDYVELVKELPIKSYAGNTAIFPVENPCLVSRIRLLVYPDGGLNRVRAFGLFLP